MNLLIIALVASVVLNVIFVVEKLMKYVRRKFDEAVLVEAQKITASRKQPTKKPVRENMAPEHAPRQQGQQPYHIPRSR